MKFMCLCLFGNL